MLRSILTLDNQQIANFISGRAEQANISCKTLIVTLFGDVVSQHGDWIWLGSIIELFEPLGYSERLVRTSVFRLVEDEWLQANKVGRKSYYSLTEQAVKLNEKAARRIYSKEHSAKNNNWLLVLPSFVSENKMPEFKRQLNWLGFSNLATNTFAHPSMDKTSLEETLQELDLPDSVIIFTSQTIDHQSETVLKKLVFEKWNLQSLQDQYQSLINIYQKFENELNQSERKNDHQGLLLRLLMIHEYRRILLKDHELSKNMLPKNWSGFHASLLIKKLYQQFESSSCCYISNQLQSSDGTLPSAIPHFMTRFK